jgi:hypothetical protein
MFETTMPGVFAVGDVRHGSVKRVASAAGEGAVCVRIIHDYSDGQSQRALRSSRFLDRHDTVLDTIGTAEHLDRSEAPVNPSMSIPQ